MRIDRTRLTGSSSNGPDPQDVARFDAWCRENFAGCSAPFHRARRVNLPYLLAQAERKPLPQGREIWLRVRWYRTKRALKSREARIAALTILLMVAFLFGRVFAEPVLSCVPSADGLLPPDCETSSVATLKEWLAGTALLLLFVGSVLVLHVLMYRDTPPDEGRVSPPRGRW